MTINNAKTLGEEKRHHQLAGNYPPMKATSTVRLAKILEN